MVKKLKEIKEKEIIPGFKGKFIHGEKMTLAFWNVKKGSKIPLHNHIHEQTLFVKKGVFELEIDNEKIIIEENEVILIPSNIMHAGIAITDCELIDIFSPSREEYTNE